MAHDKLYFPNFRVNSDLLALKRWKLIMQNRKQKHFTKKTVIVQQGEKVNFLYFIISGLVEYTYICDDGTPELLEILGDGSLFCLQPIFGDNPAVGSFIALQDSVISCMDIDELNYYLSLDNNLAKELLEELARITGGLIRRTFAHTFPADQKVLEAICLLAEYEKRRTPGAEKIYISFSQDELARITRTTRVTVTKVLSKLKLQNQVETAYGGIIVRDLDGLKGFLSGKE